MYNSQKAGKKERKETHMGANERAMPRNSFQKANNDLNEPTSTGY
jgi:hypothetical protein